MTQNVELILYNFVHKNHGTIGYFQGLNFVANYCHSLMDKRCNDAFHLLNLVSEHLYNVL